jgi:hypothetical protein
MGMRVNQDAIGAGCLAAWYLLGALLSGTVLLVGFKSVQDREHSSRAVRCLAGLQAPFQFSFHSGLLFNFFGFVFEGPPP